MRYSRDEVYRSAVTAGTKRSRMEEWQAPDQGVLCVPATRIKAGWDSALCSSTQQNISSLYLSNLLQIEQKFGFNTAEQRMVNGTENGEQ